jgi:hypothetical protein
VPELVRVHRRRSGVPAFSAPERIFGQLRVDRDRSTFLWGPEFVLNALFVQYEDNLLGRIDFFNVFNVVFASEGPTMHIYDLSPRTTCYRLVYVIKSGERTLAQARVQL